MRDFIALLLKHRVRFALCGGFAVTFYGFLRATMDIDLLIYPDTDNAQRMVSVLEDFGFGGDGILPAAFESPGTTITLGVQPNQIDLLTSMSSEAAESVFSDLESSDLWGMKIPVVSRRALLRAKREAGRPRDRIDVEELTRGDDGSQD